MRMHMTNEGTASKTVRVQKGKTFGGVGSERPGACTSMHLCFIATLSRAPATRTPHINKTVVLFFVHCSDCPANRISESVCTMSLLPSQEEGVRKIWVGPLVFSMQPDRKPFGCAASFQHNTIQDTKKRLSMFLPFPKRALETAQHTQPRNIRRKKLLKYSYRCARLQNAEKKIARVYKR